MLRIVVVYKRSDNQQIIITKDSFVVGKSTTLYDVLFQCGISGISASEIISVSIVNN